MASSSPDLARIETAAVAICRAAGERALLAYQSTLGLEFKGSKQDHPVTVADREVEAFLRTELRRVFPEHGLVGEELQDDIAADAEFVWALDPIDGTANFASHIPLWGVSMGLLRHGAPVVGCIWVPVGPTRGPGVFHARLGGAAWFDDQRVCVSTAADERGQLMAVPGQAGRAFLIRRPPAGQPHASRQVPDARTLGTCTGELVMIASGALRAGVFLAPGIWDMAAGALIVREAGGVVHVWRQRAWQDFDAFVPMPPEKGGGPPALRHWVEPFLVGAPDAVERFAARMTWHPRPFKRLRRLLGLG